MKYILLAFVVAIATAAVFAQSSSERPPNISADSWMPISNTAGIVVTKRYPNPTAVVAPDTDEARKLMRAAVPSTVDGVLMVKYEGRWFAVRWEQRPVEALPLGSGVAQ